MLNVKVKKETVINRNSRFDTTNCSAIEEKE